MILPPDRFSAAERIVAHDGPHAFEAVKELYNTYVSKTGETDSDIEYWLAMAEAQISTATIVVIVLFIIVSCRLIGLSLRKKQQHVMTVCAL